MAVYNQFKKTAINLNFRNPSGFCHINKIFNKTHAKNIGVVRVYHNYSHFVNENKSVVKPRSLLRAVTRSKSNFSCALSNRSTLEHYLISYYHSYSRVKPTHILQSKMFHIENIHQLRKFRTSSYISSNSGGKNLDTPSKPNVDNASLHEELDVSTSQSSSRIPEKMYVDLTKSMKDNENISGIEVFDRTNCSDSDYENVTKKSEKKSFIDDFDVDSVIETWFYEVNQFGVVEINLPLPIVIKPLNPQQYPDMNRVILSVFFDTSKSDRLPDSRQLADISDLYDIRVKFDKDVAKMCIDGEITPGLDLPVVCHLFVPLKCELAATTAGNSDLSVESLECQKLAVQSGNGDILLKKLKCGTVNATSRSGNINVSGNLLSNAVLQTGQLGDINAEKIQGSSVSCRTQVGETNISALYCDSADMQSDTGSFNLGNCHGNVYLQANNSLVRIGSLEGDLDVSLQSGGLTAFISRHEKVDIDLSEGDIVLSFPEGTNTDLNLNCSTINLDKNINPVFYETGIPLQKEGHLGERGRSVLNARTLTGEISLFQADWIQTTKFAKFFESDP